MIAFYVILSSVIILGVVCAGLIATVTRLHGKVANQERDFTRERQNLRHEINAKFYPLEKRFYNQLPGTEAVVYDGSKEIKPTDFAGNGARAWDYVAHRFSDGSGEGSHQINGNDITINRTNTAGRYELYLKRFVFEEKECNVVPANPAQDARNVRLTFEAKRENASHLLRFVFKGENSKEVLDEKDYVVFNPDWEKVELYFSVSAKEPSLFRIDDLSVLEAPGAVQIRNLILFEKK
jgi:hypothetical protein